MKKTEKAPAVKQTFDSEDQYHLEKVEYHFQKTQYHMGRIKKQALFADMIDAATK